MHRLWREAWRAQSRASGPKRSPERAGVRQQVTGHTLGPAPTGLWPFHASRRTTPVVRSSEFNVRSGCRPKPTVNWPRHCRRTRPWSCAAASSDCADSLWDRRSRASSEGVLFGVSRFEPRRRRSCSCLMRRGVMGATHGVLPSRVDGEAVFGCRCLVPEPVEEVPPRRALVRAAFPITGASSPLVDKAEMLDLARRLESPSPPGPSRGYVGLREKR